MAATCSRSTRGGERFRLTLALRRTGPDDFDVIHDGEIVGRIYRMKADRELGVG